MKNENLGTEKSIIGEIPMFRLTIRDDSYNSISFKSSLLSQLIGIASQLIALNDKIQFNIEVIQKEDEYGNSSSDLG